MYALVETEEDGGCVRHVEIFSTEREAVDRAVEIAREDGYLSESPGEGVPKKT